MVLIYIILPSLYCADAPLQRQYTDMRRLKMGIRSLTQT